MLKKTGNRIPDLVVNWHLLEPCQFKCKYCYAEWEKTRLPEIYKDPRASSHLIEQIALLEHGRSAVRLSFAGGEPLLDKKLSAKIDRARDHQLAVSIISNGHLLKQDFLRENGKKIAMLGISIDSLEPVRNQKIGRRTLTDKQTDYQNIIKLLSVAREINPDIRIKINTVVNQFNFDEDLSELIDRIKPDKWKVLRVLPTTVKSRIQAISDEQFMLFRKKHTHISCAVFEDNECMKNSYLMIDPYGRFFFNKENGEYGYSDPILTVGIEEAFVQTSFDEVKFSNRYSGGVR